MCVKFPMAAWAEKRGREWGGGRALCQQKGDWGIGGWGESPAGLGVCAEGFRAGEPLGGENANLIFKGGGPMTSLGGEMWVQNVQASPPSSRDSKKKSQGVEKKITLVEEEPGRRWRVK